MFLIGVIFIDHWDKTFHVHVDEKHTVYKLGSNFIIFSDSSSYVCRIIQRRGRVHQRLLVHRHLVDRQTKAAIPQVCHQLFEASSTRICGKSCQHYVVDTTTSLNIFSTHLYVQMKGFGMGSVLALLNDRGCSRELKKIPHKICVKRNRVLVKIIWWRAFC